MANLWTEHMTVYSILGKVAREQDKVYYVENWRKLFPILDNLLGELPFKKIQSKQVFMKFLKMEKDGSARVTYRNAAAGGLMNWSLKNFEKVATKHLVNNEHLIYEFDNSPKEMLHKYYERGRELVELVKHEVLASVVEDPKQRFDFVFRIMPERNRRSFNQYANMFVSDALMEKLGRNRIETAIDTIIQFMNGIRTGVTDRSFEHLVEMLGHVPVIDPIIIRSYSADDKLDFIEHTLGQWTIYQGAGMDRISQRGNK